MIMANITPASTITLYSNVDITNGQQIAFRSSADQIAYFNSKKIAGHEKTKCSYVRHQRGWLKIQDKMGIMLTCNYISWKNGDAGFENKTIYARVIDFNYINNETVQINYVIDWFQTFMFDVTYESATLEREHLSQADWTLMESNPFTENVYELQTPENNLVADKSMEKYYDSGAFITPYSSGGYAHDTSDVVNTWATLPVIAMLISNYDTNEYDGIENYFDVFIDSEGNVTKNDEYAFYNVTFPNTIKTPVPRAFNIGLIGCNHSENSYPDPYDEYQLRVDKLKLAIDTLTFQGLTCQIIGLFLVNMEFVRSWLVTVGAGVKKLKDNWYGIGLPTLPTGVINKKLMRAPFHYIRVETTNGDIKEYNYEDFVEVIEGRKPTGFTGAVSARLFEVGNFDGNPKSALVPYMYKGERPVTGSTEFVDRYFPVNLDVNERVEFDTYPQIGFTTDAYLTYLSSEYLNSIAGRTRYSVGLQKENANAKVAGSIIGGIGDVVTGVGTGASAGGVAGPVGAVVGGVGGGLMGGAKGVHNYANASVEAENLMTGIANANAVRTSGYFDASNIASGAKPDMLYNDSKSAYVADEYHAGSAGSLGYYLGIGDPASFKITRVSLKNTFLLKYDAYLTRYGYSSSRVGLPRICNYMTTNTVSTGLLPKFLLQSNGQYETYVKCQDIDVKSTMKPVSDFFEQMFKNGMRFVDGSSLITP